MSLPALGSGMVPEKRRGRASECRTRGEREVDRSDLAARLPRYTGRRSQQRHGRGGTPGPPIDVQAEAGAADGCRPADAERIQGRVGEVVPRRAHNPEVAGSTPASSSKLGQRGADETPVPSTICQPAAHDPGTWRFADEATGTQGRHHFDKPQSDRARGAQTHDGTTAGSGPTRRDPRRRNHSPAEVVEVGSGAPQKAAHQPAPTVERRGEVPARARQTIGTGFAAAGPVPLSGGPR